MWAVVQSKLLGTIYCTIRISHSLRYLWGVSVKQTREFRFKTERKEAARRDSISTVCRLPPPSGQEAFIRPASLLTNKRHLRVSVHALSGLGMRGSLQARSLRNSPRPAIVGEENGRGSSPSHGERKCACPPRRESPLRVLLLQCVGPTRGL